MRQGAPLSGVCPPCLLHRLPRHHPYLSVRRDVVRLGIMGKRLSDKRKKFVQEYLKDLNITQAAIRAGYSERTAYSQGQRLMKNVEIQAEIAKARKRAAKRNEVSLDRVIEEYRRLAFADTTDAIYIRDGRVYVHDTESLTVEQRAAISEIRQTKDGIAVKFHSKTAALEALGKHLGLFVERTENSGKIEVVYRRGKPEGEGGTS